MHGSLRLRRGPHRLVFLVAILGVGLANAAVSADPVARGAASDAGTPGSAQGTPLVRPRAAPRTNEAPQPATEPVQARRTQPALPRDFDVDDARREGDRLVADLAGGARAELTSDLGL